MMDNVGFASSRGDGFPSGLRVLVVDDDLTWLKILEKMLKKCFYEVTTCCLAMEALSILRERKNGFDIVISDVNMPDMDGFKLLEHVGLEMDLPVIMMSVDGETSRVMKGVQHGACDYLLKPIRMKELRNIWQHVLRKRINDVQNFDEVIQMMRNGSEQTQSVAVHNYLNEISPTRKRKDADCKNIDSTELGDAFAKRARVVWTVELHQKFVKAVKMIGIEKIRPKNILDSMNVPWLTRENVASHLQKYRLYLSRLQRDNGDKPFEISNHLDVDFCLVKHSDISTNAEEIYFGAREISSRKHMNAENGASSSNIYCTGDLEVKDTKSKSFKLQNKKIRVGESVESDMKSANIDANIMEKNSWGGETKNSHYENVSKFHKNRFEHADSELALVAFGKDYKFQRDESEDLYDLHHSNESDLMANVPVHLYDALRFDWWSEAPGCPMMDQSLSIADTVHFSSSYYPVS